MLKKGELFWVTCNKTPLLSASSLNMPTDPHAVSLLLLDQVDLKCPDDTSVWTWPEWQKCTGFSEPPYSPQFMENHPSNGFSSMQQEALQSFFAKFSSLKPKHQSSFVMKKTPDNNHEGTKLWHHWVTLHWKQWKLFDVIEKSLKESGLDPWTLMAQDNTKEACFPRCYCKIQYTDV